MDLSIGVLSCADRSDSPGRVAGVVAARVAYLVSKYPAPSHTFIRREVDALRRRGVPVETFSLRRPRPDELRSETDRREVARTWYARPAPPGRLLAAHLEALRASPRRYRETLREALRHRVPGVKGSSKALRAFVDAIALAGELRRRGHVRLHNHFANDGGDVGYLAARHLGLAWSLTLHGTSEFDYPAVLLLPAKIRAATFVACVSHFGRAQAMRAVDPAHWPKLLVVRCGVELDQLPDRQPRAGPGPLRVISVGRLSPEKGHVGLLAAFVRALERGGQAELRLIGDGPERERVRQAVERLGLGSRCSLRGRLSEPEVLREMAAADLFALPSLMEGLPVVLMEAMALGVPVVAPRVAGIPELVEHARTGLLFHPGDWDELAAHMLTLLEDPRRRIVLGAAGRARVAAEFDVAQAVGPLYDRFVAPIGEA